MGEYDNVSPAGTYELATGAHGTRRRGGDVMGCDERMVVRYDRVKNDMMTEGGQSVT